jgi:hypothetical protein
MLFILAISMSGFERYGISKVNHIINIKNQLEGLDIAGNCLPLPQCQG